ncbi:MAG: hypothetical protein Q8R10_19595 [Pseudomonas sp.]|uniref:hypothetical protein n=1 Tax=Pseudomonas sp. TaxID=306 RepID=UPI0027348155|nr:hypothetical protein [Pseudomonas sp.]MDP3848629.1 hypothetical protein [Pseudomonas sp.]
MQPARLDLRIVQGATLRKPLLLMQPSYVYRPIGAIQKTAPLRLTVPAHGMPAAWPCWIEGATGWSALNRDKQRERFRIAAVVDADTLEFNDLNGAVQNASGGHLVYQAPVDLTGASARLHIRDAVGALLLALTLGSGLEIAGPGRLLLTLSAAQTAAITWLKGVYDLELTMSDGSVDRWAEGEVVVSLEQTHD